MNDVTLWFPLGRHYHCIVEKAQDGWQLRVLEDGTTIVTHRIENYLAERLLSARGIPPLSEPSFPVAVE